MNNIDRTFIVGFVKRANQYGFTIQNALEILAKTGAYSPRMLEQLGKSPEFIRNIDQQMGRSHGHLPPEQEEEEVMRQAAMMAYRKKHHQSMQPQPMQQSPFQQVQGIQQNVKSQAPIRAPQPTPEVTPQAMEAPQSMDEPAPSPDLWSTLMNHKLKAGGGLLAALGLGAGADHMLSQ